MLRTTNARNPSAVCDFSAASANIRRTPSATSAKAASPISSLPFGKWKRATRAASLPRPGCR